MKTTRSKILLFFAAAAFLIFLYLLATSGGSEVERPQADDEPADQAAGVSAAELRANYQASAREILVAYENLTATGEATVERVRETKAALLELVVPAEYKDLHLGLVLALIKIETYLTTGEEEAAVDGRQLIEQAKLKYEWLANGG